jgi:hypothetical protein
LLCIFIRISISKHRSCVGNNYAKKHVQLSTNNYLGIFYNFICKPKYWCTTMYADKKNHCHCMNYLNLNHSCFFHINLFHINNIVETSEKKSSCRYSLFWNPTMNKPIKYYSILPYFMTHQIWFNKCHE